MNDPGLDAAPATEKKAAWPAWAERFLEVFEDSALITEAAKAAGVNRSTVYRLRDRDEDFAAAWGRILEWTTEELEQVAYKRATDGSDTMLIFLLKARRPEVYREGLEIKHSGQIAVPKAVDDAINEEIERAHAEIDRLTERLAKVAGRGEGPLPGDPPGDSVAAAS